MGAPFSTAFLSGDRRAEPFLSAAYRTAGSRRTAVSQATRRPASPALLDVLRRQNRALGPSAERERQLDRLGQTGTVAIVTGQQMGLFLGPLYSFYKAAAAIADARALETETGVPCVPIFWLQTEDHDFPEIDHCHLLAAEGERLKLQLPCSDRESRVCVEQRRLDEGIEPLLRLVESRLESLPFARETLDLLRRHYRPGASVAEAFSGLLAELFADEGLLVLNPRDAVIARLAVPLHRRAVQEAEPIARLLLDRARALEDAGFDIQVAVRPRSPLSFFHPQDADGPRYRIEPDGLDWRCVSSDIRVPASEMIDALECAPLRFSTSALLRPLLQDTLLPTAGYVGGPGEISYLAQLGPLYERWQVPQPMAIPRARFRVIERRIQSTLTQLGLDAAQVEEPKEAVAALLAQNVSGLSPDTILPRGKRALSSLFEEIGQQSHDPDVESALRRTKGTIERALSRLTERYRRSMTTRDRVRLDRLERVQSALFPHGEPQERVDALPSFTARFGIPRFKELVFGALVPFSGDTRELTP